MQIRIKGIIIGEKKFEHNIEMPNYVQEMKDIYIAEFLKKQYPDKIKKICDIEHETIENKNG